MSTPDLSIYENIVEPFLANVAAHPDRPCLICGDRVFMTYADVDLQARKIARAFRDRGIVAGDRIAYLIPNSAELVLVYLAIQRAGAVAVPLNFRLIPREIAYLTNATDAKMLVFDQQFVDKVVEARHDFIPHIDLMEVGASTIAPRLYYMAEGAMQEDVPLFRDADALSRIQFTGGSTGLPKGASRTHGQDLAEMSALLPSNLMGEMDCPVALIQCPLEHHGGHSWFMGTLTAGGTVVICTKFDPASILSQIEKYRVTHMILLPPTTYLRLLNCPDAKTRDMTSMRIVQSAAGAMVPEVIERIYEVFPNAEINYGWGQSESGTGTSMRLTREMLEARSPLLDSVGKPMGDLRLRIVDDSGDDVAQGEAGEAIVSSAAVMSGYYKQPALTAEVFTDDGWLRTGDMMVEDTQGYYYLKSRKKDMIKSGGENVFIGEVQTAILRNPDVEDCVVFGTSDPVMGEAVAAVVQPRSGVQLTLEDVQEGCKSYIASYKKPRYVEFVDDLGRDDAGKVRLDRVIEYFNSRRSKAAEK